MKKLVLVLTSIAVLCIGAGAASWFAYASSRPSVPLVQNLFDELQLTNLPKSKDRLDHGHIANGVTTPTNRWFSGMILADKPGYAMPNSYKLTPNGFEVGLPRVQVAPNAIFAPHEAGVTIVVPGTTTYKMTRYDDLSMDITYYDSRSQPIATATFMAGSPYVSVLAAQPVMLQANLEHPIEMNNQVVGGEADWWYGLRVAGGTHATIDDDQAILPLSPGKFVSVYTASGRDNLDMVANYASNRVMNATLSYKKQDNKWHTEFTLRTANGEPTLFVRMPHQLATNQRVDGPEYESMYGLLKSGTGNMFGYDVPVVAVVPAHKNTAQQDIKNKQLIDSILSDDKLAYASGDNFVDINGVDRNNILHTYASLFYAAGTIGSHDPAFANEHRSVLNLLAANVANYTDMSKLPKLRLYDAYFGHGWTDSPSDQSYSSPDVSIKLWQSLSLWASVAKNTQLQTEAAWALANETETYGRYWNNIAIDGYDHVTFGRISGDERRYLEDNDNI